MFMSVFKPFFFFFKPFWLSAVYEFPKAIGYFYLLHFITGYGNNLHHCFLYAATKWPFDP